MRQLILISLFLVLPIGCSRTAGTGSGGNPASAPGNSGGNFAGASGNSNGGVAGSNAVLPNGAFAGTNAAGVFDRAQVRQYLIGELKLRNVKITSASGSNYTATGQTPDRTHFDVTIEQEPGGLRYQWTASNGQTGSGAFGTLAGKK